MIKTNYDYLKSLSLEEMADRNVQYVTSVDIDYDYEENSYETTYSGYTTSDGEKFMDYNDALEHEIEWLKSPYIDRFYIRVIKYVDTSYKKSNERS